MSALTNYSEAKLLDHLLAVAAFTAPSGIYGALFTDATTDAGGGTEVTGGSYAREAITFGAAAGPDPMESSNSGDVTYTTATAAWGTITNAALFDAVSSGNMLVHGALTSSRIIGIGDTFRFLSGQLKVRLA
jgi:hypothetical protein